MSGVRAIASKISPAQEHAVNPDVLKTSVDNGIAVVTLGSANRIFLDQEMTDGLTTALEELAGDPGRFDSRDRKSTRLNSSHQIISYAVFCLKKKKKIT